MTDLAPYLPGIGLSYVAFLLGVAGPGPNVLAVIRTSMAVGRKAGPALALGGILWIANMGFCNRIWPVSGVADLCLRPNGDQDFWGDLFVLACL
jgi:hypothetical protein